MAPKMVVLAAMAVAGAFAADVRVEVSGGNQVQQPMLWKARTTLTWLYERAGIQVAWGAGNGRVIRVRFTRGTPAGLRPEALAYAMPFASGPDTIVVMIDRVEAAVRESRVTSLLAYVLAHEIGHVLQACDRHSEIGIMKARWVEADYGLMGTFQLGFTQEDVDLIHLGLHRHQVFATIR
jgi:hypothetical protein